MFEGLLQAAPRQFARVPLDPGTLHYLTSREGEKEKEVKGEKVKVTVLDVVPDCLKIKAVMEGEWRVDDAPDYSKVL